MHNEYAKVPISGVTVAILAGGKSARFGSDKALATIPGGTLSFLERAVEVANSVSDEVIIIGPKREGLDRPDLRFIPDKFRDEGPAGGLVTALLSVSTPHLIVLACDQPLITPSDLIALLEGGRDRPAAAFTSVDGALQPLPCVLDIPTCREKATSAFAAGLRSLREMLEVCGVVLISAGRIGSLIDVDTRDDYRFLIDSLAPERTKGSNPC